MSVDRLLEVPGSLLKKSVGATAILFDLSAFASGKTHFAFNTSQVAHWRSGDAGVVATVADPMIPGDALGTSTRRKRHGHTHVSILVPTGGPIDVSVWVADERGS
jgi:hypothetical protein